MAEDTPAAYRSLVIYEVFVRNHGPNGNFGDVTADLPRIAGMGVDVVWLMPIHPIGEAARKGQLGSPYSIRNYREVNPEYGRLEDFAALVERAHELSLKVMIDVVYNHTAHDAPLLAEHPEWYHRDADGRPVTTVPEWSDIIDLSYHESALWDYLIASLKFWVGLGVDGFRCDVASIVPVAFWERARREVAQVKPGVIWLAESVHPAFIEDRRRRGLTAYADAEIYRAFDLTYDYDIWSVWEAVVAGQRPLTDYLAMLRFQDAIYPASYVKMRCPENHDQPRIMRRAATPAQAMAWTAFQAFNKGAFMIYAGLEAASRHAPSLFDEDKIEWGAYPLQSYITRLARLKKHPAQMRGLFTLLAAEPLLAANWQAGGSGLYGVFNVAGYSGALRAPLPDGVYEDVINERPVTVEGGQIVAPETAAVVRHTTPITANPLHTDMMDYRWPG